MLRSNDTPVNSEYFSKAIEFFHEMRWLYSVPLTEILVCDSFEAFPEGWLNVLEKLDNQSLNHFVSEKIIPSDWPESLKNFVKKCREMDGLSESIPSVNVDIPKNFTRGLSGKKKHEIMHLSHLINEQCKNENIHLIIDFGAGLGYVCQLLHYLYGYKVLGLEANEQNVKTARIRQTKYYPESLDHVKYAHCQLKSSSLPIIDAILQREFPRATSVCCVGLHACGDLSIYASDIFSKMPIARCLILVSCCYHKLSTLENSDSQRQYFTNFPISSIFRNSIKKANMDVSTFLKIPFLRLACQEPTDRWKDISEESHSKHSFYALARATLQLYANQCGCILKKKARKGTRKSQCLTIETYIRDSLSRYTFQHIEQESSSVNSDTHFKRLLHLWEEQKSKLKTAEIYTGLQLMLQGAAESLVLNDRFCWLNERNLLNSIVPVMNKSLSPRSHALISQRMII
ncbi:methyltransferase-like protein 25B [Prorops nasuta]|uniref:methyltransferase-like protein 25B n=1 Tax=Prorops nasuta TaxID=863751 RepID=UPI0034CE4A28